MSEEDQGKEQHRVCDDILLYLIHNRNAGDTLEGVAEWWLLRQRIWVETLTVAQALKKLVEDGLIVEQKGPDSRVIYRANPSSEVIQAMLNKMQDDSPDES